MSFHMSIGAAVRVGEILSEQSRRDIDFAEPAPYPQRTIRTFRAAMKTLQDPAQQAQKILDIVRDLGLEPYVPPTPTRDHPRRRPPRLLASAGSHLRRRMR